MNTRKLAEAVRVLTCPPFAACAAVLLLGRFGGLYPGAQRIWALLFLAVLPLTAYAVWWAVPPLRRGGRRSQRALAVGFSVAGYIGGMVCCLLTGAGRRELIIYLTYLVSGALIALCSYAFGFRSSGHSCGVAGPVTALVCFLGPVWAAGYLLLLPVFWSSVAMGRHTVPQLVAGGLFSSVTLVALCLFML